MNLIDLITYKSPTTQRRVATYSLNIHFLFFLHTRKYEFLITLFYIILIWEAGSYKINKVKKIKILRECL